MKRIRFTTETGSKYEIDCDKLVACRVWKTEESGPVREDISIPLLKLPMVEIGYSVVFDCPPYPGAPTISSGRVVVTSRVVSLSVAEQDNA